jgi:CNT family concentrative nucleoside transporter
MNERFISFLGLLAFLGLAWSLSINRRRFPWRVVIWGLGLQVLFALFILKTEPGGLLFEGAQASVLKLNDFALEGAALVFGPLASEQALQQAFGPATGPLLVVLVSATIILVSAVSSLLYHWGILPRVVQGAAWIMRSALRTNGSETFATAANIFIGQTEAPLLIKPYLNGMTRSELMAMMTGGMATIAGGVLAAYAAFGRQAGFPEMAGHLVAASVMNAPAALIMAKIILPETEPSETAAGAPLKLERTATNSLDAICRGASDGLMLAMNVLAMLIAFVAVVALANFLLEQVTRPLGTPIQFEVLLGWVHAPLAWLMGVPAGDCLTIGEILGKRVVLNEFLGYLDLTGQRGLLDHRSFVLTTYALCGFANFGSIAIQIGGIGALAPQRRADLARLGPRAMVAGLLACYLTASIVGVIL